MRNVKCVRFFRKKELHDGFGCTRIFERGKGLHTSHCSTVSLAQKTKGGVVGCCSEKNRNGELFDLIFLLTNAPLICLFEDAPVVYPCSIIF